MSKYLKLFETTSDYEAYINGGGVVLPNVSVAKDAPKTVYFNPIPPMNIITYEASAKLAETTNEFSNGFHKNAFSGKNGQLAMTSHTFENGAGTIEFDGDVTSIGNYAFSGCEGLTSVTIPSGVTSIGNYAFQYCKGLTSIIIPNGVTSIGTKAFSNCTSLTNVTIGSGVTSINIMAFNGCSGLTSMVVDSANTVYDSRDNCNAIIKTSTNELIIGCNNTVIPNTVTSIGQSAFNECRGLTSITIPNSVTSIDQSAFNGCSGLTNIVVDSANTVFDSRDNCNAIIKTLTNELTLGCKNTVIPNTVTSIGNSAFYQCTGLTNITIPDSVTNIGDWTFYYCTGLTSITIGSSVTSIGVNTFGNCSGLTSITSLATTAPTIQSNTFYFVKTGGTLTVPSGSSGYNVWMGTGNYYLGKYNWRKVEQ